MTAATSDLTSESKAHTVPAHQDRAYDYVECPVTGARAKDKESLDPSNLVIHPHVLPGHFCTCAFSTMAMCLLRLKARLNLPLNPFLLIVFLEQQQKSGMTKIAEV